MTGFGDDQKDWNGKNEAQCCSSAGRRWRAMTHRLGSKDVSIRVVSGE
jgi:hypothetical protein